VLLEQPDEVGAGGLLVGREQQDQVAVRLETLRPQANEVCHQHRGAILDVPGAAAVVVAVLFHHFQRVRVPGLWRRRHCVQVRQHQHWRLRRLRAAVPGNEIAIAGRQAQNLHIGGGKLRTNQHGRQSLRRRPGIALVASTEGIHRHELAKNVAREHFG
jgi:hypothetical protein